VSRPGEWVLLAYRLPREPSTPRVTVWRKLARLGVAQLLDGLVALPADARTKEQLEWIADEVIEAGGEATVWVGRPGSGQQERAMAQRMAAGVADHYRSVAAQAHDALGSADLHVQRRSLARLRRELRRITARDFFPPPERAVAHAAVERLAATLDVDLSGAAQR
jgi:ChrB-like protein